MTAADGVVKRGNALGEDTPPERPPACASDSAPHCREAPGDRLSFPDAETPPRIRATTILAVRRDGKVALGGDGQVTVGETVMKANAPEGARARATASCSPGSPARRRRVHAVREVRGEARALSRTTCRARPSSWPRTGAAIACCGGSRRCWRSPTRQHGFIISGTGDIIEPDDGILAIGSGGSYALAAARALVANTPLAAGGDRARGARDRRRDLHLHEHRTSRCSRPEG